MDLLDGFEDGLLSATKSDPFEGLDEGEYLFLGTDPFAEVTETSLSTEGGVGPKTELVLHPFDTAIPLGNSVPQVASHPVGCEEENRMVNGNGGKVVGGVKKKKKVVKEEGVRDKVAQRKLRNKESARRYREKQVARRRQLENYTRSLTEQNRELECLHDRLLRMTCDRRLRSEVRVDETGVRSVV